MTALAAIWGFADAGGPAACARMLDAQAIYGPDPPAIATLGPVVVGRRLHPLTAEDALDRGPVRGRDRALLMAADIRIDNRRELAAMLDLSDRALAELSDPALAMRAIERWGNDALARIVGPFALILWDEAAKTLTLARDPMGERPLHFHRGTGFVAVASMPKGLHALPDVPYAAAPDAAADFLALLPETTTESFFAGIERVPPGHRVEITPAGTSSARFWTWPETELRMPRDDDYVDAFRDAFDRAVARRLRIADGAIGAHLSGGLDSGGVAATAARLLAPGRLFAFTAVPSVAAEVPRGTIADEGPLARSTAALHPNIEHLLIASSDTSPLALFDRHFQLFERPILNPSNAVWFEAIADAARARGIRVMLTGQLGNLTVSHDGLPHLPQLVARGRLIAMTRLIARLRARGMSWRTIGAATAGPFLPSMLWTWLHRRYSIGAPLTAYSAIRAEAVASDAIGARAAARGYDLNARPTRDGRAIRRWALSRVDMGVYNKGVLAGWGIDLRDPTADRDLASFCLSIPERQYILDGVPRSLARRGFADRLSAEMVGERRRGYQSADWHLGLAAARPAIAAELDSLDRSPLAARLIDTGRLRQALAEWPSGDWNADEQIDRYRQSLLRGLAAGHFLRRVARTN